MACPRPLDNDCVRDITPMFCKNYVEYHMPHICYQQFSEFELYDVRSVTWTRPEIKFKHRKAGVVQEHSKRLEQQLLEWGSRKPAEQYMTLNEPQGEGEDRGFNDSETENGDRDRVRENGDRESRRRRKNNGDRDRERENEDRDDDRNGDWYDDRNGDWDHERENEDRDRVRENGDKTVNQEEEEITEIGIVRGRTKIGMMIGTEIRRWRRIRHRRVGHVVARHTAEDFTKLLWFTIGMMVILLGAAGSANPPNPQGIQKLAELILNPGCRREKEADYIGLLLMASAGYDPRVAPKVHEILDDNDYSDSKYSALFSSHPSGKKRSEAQP